jgi:hypothetical protein
MDAAVWTVRFAMWLLASCFISSGWPATGSASQPAQLDRPLPPRLNRQVRTGIARLECVLRDSSATAR